MVPDLKGMDPDDAFSAVPYEKGYGILFYLEKCIGDREVVSGSGRSAQKSEKLAYFEPISEPQFEEKIGIFFKKCGIFLIRRLQFL